MRLRTLTSVRVINVINEGQYVRASPRRLFGTLLVLALAASVARADRVDDLSAALTNDSSWRVRLQAAVVLGRLHDRRGVPALMHALTDQVETVRGMAAQVLGDLGDPSAQAALERAKRDPSPFVRGQALVAANKLAGGSTVTLTSRPVNPRALHVEVGGIGAKTAQAGPELQARLREFITRELERTPGLTLEGAPRSGFLIDSAITQISRRTTADYVEISCEVSLIVGKLPSKAMVMMTSGGATVQAPKAGFRPEREKALQVDALEGAVRGAHENLLAFLKSQEHL
jgi:HEAT repeats